MWNKAGGMPVEGMTRRRKAERALFLDDDVSRLQSVAPSPAWGEDGPEGRLSGAHVDPTM
jgi:hypothetical protein